MKKLSNGLSVHKDLGSEPIMSFVNFMKNISDYYSTQDQDKLYTVIVETVDNLLVKSDDWKNLSQIDKSKAITKLVDLVDGVLFQEEAIGLSSQNIVAEVVPNMDQSVEFEFPINRYLQSKTNERVYLKIDEPNVNQKFLFVIYKNINDFFPVKILNYKPSKKRFINSNIISFKVNDAKLLEQLKYRPVRLLFRHLHIQNERNFLYKPLCSYWKYDTK